MGTPFLLALNCLAGLEKDLRAAVGALDQPLAGELELSTAIGAGLAAVELRRFHRVEDTLVPVDVSREEPLADELVQIVLYLVAGRFELQHDIADLDLATCLDDVEQRALLADVSEITLFGTSPDQDEDTAADQRQHDEEEQEDEAQQCSRQLEIALGHPRREPGADGDADGDADRDEDQTDRLA